MTITHNAAFNFTDSVTIFFVGDTGTVTGASRRFISKVDAFSIGKGSGGAGKFTTFGVKNYETSDGLFVIDTPIIATYVLDTSLDVDFRKNGAVFENIAGSVDANTSSNDLFVSSATEPWTGSIGEILFYNRLLSASEISEVERYLSNKWGITI